MFGQALAIARNTFIESLRQPVTFVLVVAGGLLQIFNTLLSGYSMGYTEQTEVSGDNKLLLDVGLATVLVLATLLSAFLATSVLSREIENRTALTVISKPVPRPLFVVGKYLGVSATIVLCTIIMLIFFSFAIRHQVMSTARDHLDGPVVLFSTLAVLAAIGIGIWGNYFYGWVFASTAVGFMLPLVAVAYIATLFMSKEWTIQAIGTDIKPQIMIASACVVLAMLVLTAVAVCCSTRLGQVMTIVVCAGVFMLGLMSNHLLGRYAFQSAPVAGVRAVEVPREQTGLSRAGDTVTIVFDSPPRVTLDVGDPLYFAPDPAGLRMQMPAQSPFRGDVNSQAAVSAAGAGPALVIQKIEPPARYTLVNVGNLAVKRLPREQDFFFAAPTRQNLLARAAWSIVPNMQVFWLVDPITQGHAIPGRYVLLVAAYAAVQVTGLLALATLLFQGRDLG